MNISLEELFRYSYVITIDDDRYVQFKSAFEFAGLPVPRKFNGMKVKGFIETTKTPGGHPFTSHQNCFMSHIALVKMAQTMDFPFICIFEDDAWPCYNVKTSLQNYISQIPDDCEALVLGNIRLFADGFQTNNGFMRLNKFYGSQAYVVFKSAYEKYFKFISENMSAPEHALFSLCLYSTCKNHFIQYNATSSMNMHKDYIWYGHSKKKIFKEFPRIEYIMQVNRLKIK